MLLIDNLKPFSNYGVVVTAFNQEFGNILEGTPSDELTVQTAQDGKTHLAINATLFIV